MGFHGLVRATEGLIFIRATPENIEKLRSALRAVYEDDSTINEISSADLLGEYPTVHYVPPTGDLYFDVMTRLGEVANFETIDAEALPNEKRNGSPTGPRGCSSATKALWPKR
jgi:hypothetical protein